MNISVNFTKVSEAAGTRVTKEAVEMLYTRYALAAELGSGKHVLEVACGPGYGLGLISRKAARVIGGDFMHEFSRRAQSHYRGRVSVLRFDAQHLPFGRETLDLVLLLEAIYYLPRADAFLRECRRILRPGGKVLICTANREWNEFNPSPFSTYYYSAAELALLLTNSGFASEIFGAFPAGTSGRVRKIVSQCRRCAVRLHLIPKTMKGKEILKRLFYGQLEILGEELRDDGRFRAPLLPIPESADVPSFKVIYAIGTRQ